MYASDLALFAITPRGLQKLIDVCELFVNNNDFLFNPAKTKLLVFRHSKFKDVTFPQVRLNGVMIEEVTETKYLAYLLCNDLSDDLDIERQV